MTVKEHNVKVNAERGSMNLVKLIEQFADEDKCRTYLEQLRWPDGVRCPRCESDKVKAISTNTYYRRDTADGLHKKGDVRSKRHQYDCSCGYQFSLKSGNVLQDSHLPLWKWFLATYLMCESKKGMSANQLKRTLGVSYEAAWYLCHRIRWAMGSGEQRKLSGTVEVDETYLGGKIRWPRTYEEKTMVLGALERNGRVVFQVGEKGHATRAMLHKFVDDVIEDDAEAIYTDGHFGYQGIGDENTRHEAVNHGRGEWVRGDVHTNGVESIWSLLDRSIMGSFHQISKQHLPAYLDEIAFRFNNRENPYLFRDTLVKLLTAAPLPYAQLVEQG